MVDCWTSGLLTQLLELMHSMWTHWNNTLHAVDDQGLPIAHSVQLQTDIYVEFQKDVEGLAWHDYHFICHGWDDVLSMSATDNQAWFQGIQLARNSTSLPTVHTRQCQLMHNFFSITDTWSPDNCLSSLHLAPQSGVSYGLIPWLWWLHFHTYSLKM
jgi:hypothetical protein